MIMVYYGGLGVGFELPEQMDLTKKNILSWEIKKLKGWNSPNLVINFESEKFEQPTPLIVNYRDVIKWLKNNT